MTRVINYPPLERLCKSCRYKCFRVEAPNFTGTNDCEYADEPIEQIKQILGIQEKIKCQ